MKDDVTRPPKHPRRRDHAHELLPTILFWLFIALVAYTLLGWIWDGPLLSWNSLMAGWRIGSGAEPLERVKVTLTALGGAGAVGYLVIKFRERSSAERNEADERLTAAVAQLGDSSPQIRIAGVYALAQVADVHGGDYCQRVVDILCGYLRSDRSAINDAAVESTVLSVLARHLRSGSTQDGDPNSADSGPGAWSHCSIDLHGATLTEELNLRGAHLNEIDCHNAEFRGATRFSETTFSKQASFSGSTFWRQVHFANASFSELATFEATTYQREADFTSTLFNGATTFESAKFSDAASFNCVDFRGTATFDRARLDNYAIFLKLHLSRRLLLYGDPVQW